MTVGAVDIEKIRRENGEIERLPVEDIRVPDGRRALNAKMVVELADSMAEIGLMTPITIRGDIEDGNIIELVAGAHRLAAAKKLGWEKIPCFVIYDRVEAEMWEISENLHRSELTVLQTSEMIDRWVILSTQQRVSRQVAAKPGRPESGTRRAARELHRDERQVRRAQKINRGLSEEAKQVAQETGLDDNQSALLEAAALPLSEQAKALRARKDRPHQQAGAPVQHVEPSELQGDHDTSGMWRSRLRELIGEIDSHLERAPSPTDRAYGLKRLDGKWQALPTHNEDGEIIEEVSGSVAVPLENRANCEEGHAASDGIASGAPSSQPSPNLSNPADPLAGQSLDAAPRSASGPDLSQDPAPLSPVEDVAAASTCGQGTPATSSNLSTDTEILTATGASMPGLPSFLDRRPRS